MKSFFPATFPTHRYPWFKVLLPFGWIFFFSILALAPFPTTDLGPFDKVLHVGVAFGTLLLLSWGAGRRSGGFLLWMSFLLLAFSFLFEIIQQYIPGRHFSYTDYACNLIGVMAGFWYLRRRSG